MKEQFDSAGTYDVYLSCRKDGGEETAAVLRDRLTAMGYHVFLDIERPGPGGFNVRLLTLIEECVDFVAICSKDSLDRCYDENDWFRTEIVHALRKEKNVIPLTLDGFEWPESLPRDIEALKTRTAVKIENPGELNSYVNYMAAEILKSEPRLAGKPAVKKKAAPKKLFSAKLALVAACSLILVFAAVFAGLSRDKSAANEAAVTTAAVTEPAASEAPVTTAAPPETTAAPETTTEKELIPADAVLIYDSDGDEDFSAVDSEYGRDIGNTYYQQSGEPTYIFEEGKGVTVSERHNDWDALDFWLTRCEKGKTYTLAVDFTSETRQFFCLSESAGAYNYLASSKVASLGDSLAFEFTASEDGRYENQSRIRIMTQRTTGDFTIVRVRLYEH